MAKKHRYFNPEALGQLGDTRAVVPSIAALKDSNRNIRWRAATALGQLGGVATELHDQQADDTAYHQTLRRLNEKPMADLRRSAATCGEEFLFIYLRLNRLRGQLIAGNPDLRAAIDIFLGQIDDDLATIQRWRDRPWTAPGYTIDTARLDGRMTLYTRWGDWFALAALGLTGLMLLDWLRHRLGGRSNAARAQQKG